MQAVLRAAITVSVLGLLCSLGGAATEEDGGGLPQIGVPPDLILEIGTRYRYELAETSRTLTYDLTTARTKVADDRVTLTWNVEMLVADSGPQGVELVVVLTRLRGKVSNLEGSRSFDSQKTTEIGGVVAIVGKESRVKLNERCEILDVGGAAVESVPKRDRPLQKRVDRHTHALFRRFMQTLPEKTVPLDGKWSAMRRFDAFHPPDVLWQIGEFEERYFVKSIADDVASLVVTCTGSGDSPRKEHQKGRWAKETDIGSADEKWKYTGTAEVHVPSGLLLARHVRGKSVSYGWHIVGGKARSFRHRNFEYSGGLRLVETVPPADERPPDDGE